MRGARRVRERRRTRAVRWSELTQCNEAGGPFSSGSRLLLFAFELAMVEQHVALASDHLALLIEEALHRAAKLAVDNVVHAGRVLGVQTAQLLEAPAGARFEAL